MKKKIRFRELLFLALILFGVSSISYSQGCDITIDKPEVCRGIIVTFKIPSTTSYSKITWNFGDGTTSTAGNPVTHVYDTYGTLPVSVTLEDASGNTKCSSNTTIRVYDNPKALFYLPDSSTQCFESNEFCVGDWSKPGGDNAPIVTRVWDVGDGTAYTKDSICHSYVSAGQYTWILNVTDSNGCTDSMVKSAQIIVLPKLAPKFTTAGGTGCPTTTVRFVNKTDTAGKGIVQWWWDFGDGTSRVTSDTTGDSIWTNFRHTYTKDGSFNPVLVVESKYGCIDSFTSYNGATNIFYWFDIKKNESGPACWDGNEICFAQEPRPKATYWLWEFDDPPSMLLNFNDEDWEPCHNYTAPGFYNITLTIYEPNCTRDTTFCAYIPLLGPMAVINLPPPPDFPANSRLSGKPIPLSYFHSAASLCVDVDGDGVVPDVVYYVRRTTGSPYAVNDKFWSGGNMLDTLWCNGDLDSIHFDTTFKDPYPCATNNDPPITGIGYPFLNTGNPQYLWDSIFETIDSVVPGDSLPWEFQKGRIYFPSSGTVNMHTMHDTDLFIPNCSGPNYVRFTNNSVKYRLYYAIDNDPSLYVYPFNDLMFDTCRNPSYPWASDSMEYWWDFGDGDACTSTVANPNIKCRFSDEIQPWHLYKEDGCYPASLTVTDHVTNCESVTSVNIVMEPPDASWDETAFGLWDGEYAAMHYLNQRATPAGIARRGVILEGIPCIGQNYPQQPSFSETLPSCARQTWWMVFDSAAAGLGGCQTAICRDVTSIDIDGDGSPDSRETHEKYFCQWVDEMTFMMMGNQWVYGEGGWKTIGLIIQTGDCFDTAFYHNYKYIWDVNATVNVHDPDLYDASTGTYPLLDYTNEQDLRLCAPHQAIITAIDTAQLGITNFTVEIAPYFSPPWVDNVYLEDSFQLTRKDTIYMICHKDSFEIDPFTGNKVYNNCFMYPSIVTGETFDRATYNALAAGGWFAKDTLKQLSLKDTLFLHDHETTSNNPIQPEHSITMPGKYYVTAIAKNVYGCYNMARYRLFVGHYTTFEADDRIICYEGGGDTVTFTHTVRYFQVKLLPTDPDLNQTPFWEDPLTPRGGTMPSTGILESIEFDCDGDGTFETPGIMGADTVTFVYNTPGDYTVSMKTIDSNGCEQVYERENYIKVVGVVADFIDTNSQKPYLCGQLIGFVDKSYGLNDIAYTYNSDGTVKSSYKVDSVVYWKWDFGDNDGTRSTSYIKNPVHTYRTGEFNVTLIVRNTNGCTDTITKAGFIDIQGPQPNFKIWKDDLYKTYEDTICVNESVIIKDSSQYMTNWIWHAQSHSPTDTISLSWPNTPDTDSLVSLRFDYPGVYTVWLEASETLTDPSYPNPVPCTEYYGDTVRYNTDPVFTVVVMERYSPGLDGDELICDSSYANFEDLSDTGFAEIKWLFMDVDGGSPIITDPGTPVKYMFTTYGAYDTSYQVIIDGSGYPCKSAYKDMWVRVLKTDAIIRSYDTTGLPVMKFYNGSKGGTNYKWTVEGIDQLTQNTSYYQQYELSDTTMFSHDFGDIKGDFRVCLYSWIDNDGLAPEEEGCIKKTCVVVNNDFNVLIEIPNVFTPGIKDGKNDLFTIKNEGVVVWDLTIYNRWGEKVYESEDPTDHWNGLNKQDGQECPGGTYYYVIDYQLRGEKAESASGTVTLVR